LRRAIGALAVAALAALGALGGGCAPEGCVLEGSLGEFYNLGCDFQRIRLYDSELSIEFVRDDGEVPVRVTVRRVHGDPPAPGGFNLKGPADIDLAKHGDVTGSHQGNPIPQFLSGTLELSEFALRDGAPVSGSFDVKFQSGQTEVSLSGSFDVPLVVVID
jgi:hypothetical protein